MPQCHNGNLSGGLNYSFCARIMPVAADRGQVTAPLQQGRPGVFVSGSRGREGGVGGGVSAAPLLNTDFIDNKATITEARHNNWRSKRQVQTNIWSDCTPASFLRVEAFLPPPEKSSLINKAKG